MPGRQGVPHAVGGPELGRHFWRLHHQVARLRLARAAPTAQIVTRQARPAAAVARAVPVHSSGLAPSGRPCLLAAESRATCAHREGSAYAPDVCRSYTASWPPPPGLVEGAMCRCACRHDTRGLHGSVVTRRMTTHCVWPANYRNPCRSPASVGHICLDHMALVCEHVGRLDCAWPGCVWRAWDRRGLCSFHWEVALGLINH